MMSMQTGMLWITVVVYLIGEQCPAQWTHTLGPYRTDVRRLAVSDTNLLAAASSGVFVRSPNGERGFRVIPSPLGGVAWGVAAWTNTALYSVPNTGVYRSTDGGATWALSNTGLSSLSVKPLEFFDMGSNGVMAFAATVDGTIHTSTNAGASWTSVHPGFGLSNCLASDGSVLFLGTSSSGIRRSTNLGTTWTTVNNGLTPSTIYALAFSGSALFCGTTAGVFRSTDNGGTWTAVNNGITTTSIKTLARVGGVLLASSDGDGPYASTNSGDSWILSRNGIASGRTVKRLVVRGNTVFGIGEGIFYSKDNGANWVEINAANSSAGIEGAAVGDERVYVATNGDGQLMQAPENEPAWIKSATTATSVRSVAASAPYAVLGTQSGAVYRSTNNGMTWTPAGSVGATADVAVQDTTVYLATSDRVYRSNDFGMSWTLLDNNWPFPIMKHLELKNIPGFGTKLFATTSEGTILLFNEGTGSWSTVFDAGLGGGAVMLANVDTFLFAAARNAGVFKAGARSASPGQWTAVNTGLANPFMRAITANSSATFVTDADRNVFYSTNLGLTWVRADSGEIPGTCESAIVNNGSLFVGSSIQDVGVWRRGLSTFVTDVPSTGAPPSDFYLKQNYPNPFNPSTKIAFRVAEYAHVSLSVYDVLGREVAALVNEVKPAGEYSVTWKANGLASGVYFYRLQTTSYVQTRKLVLLR